MNAGSTLNGQVGTMFEELESRWPGAAPELRVDALATIAAWPQVQLKLVPGEQGSGCSVAGAYIISTRPPTLAVASSASPRRRQFTALHELGHHLQQNVPQLASATRAQPHPAEFEDGACDLFASTVLIPDSVVHLALDEGKVTADAVRWLYEGSSASRAACVVRAAQFLGTSGTIAVLDATGVVTFATRHGDVFPPARGSDQSSTPLVRRALESGNDVEHDQTYVLYSTGNTSEHLYGQAAWVDGMLVAIQVVDNAGWRPFSVARTGTRTFATPFETYVCATCSTEFRAGPLHPACGEIKCPQGHCGCTLARDKMCEKCFLTKPPNQFPTAMLICVDCL